MHVYRGYYKIIVIVCSVPRGLYKGLVWPLFGLSLFVYHCIMYTKLLYVCMYSILCI